MNKEAMPVPDDLEMVRAVLAPPAPPATVQHRGRERLAALAVGAGGQVRRPRRARQVAIGAGVTLTAAAAALAVLVATAGTAAPGRGHAVSGGAVGGGAGHQVSSARDILLTAARQAAHAPAATGRYWLTREVGGTNLVVGPPGDRYTITMRGSNDQWTARSAIGSSWFRNRPLGARPATPADAAAWKRDGSPSRWTVAFRKRGGRARLVITAAPGRPFGNQTNIGDKVFAIGGTNVSIRQVRALPVTAARLRARLLRAFAAPGGSGGDLPTGRADWLWQVGTSMIMNMPLTPGTSAADYRMLAGLPGVRSIGTVRDPARRPGLAVEMTSATESAGVETSRLIVNPATGLPLAQEILVVRPGGLTVGLAPGAMASYEQVTFAGWSNSAPPGLSRP